MISLDQFANKIFFCIFNDLTAQNWIWVTAQNWTDYLNAKGRVDHGFIKTKKTQLVSIEGPSAKSG